MKIQDTGYIPVRHLPDRPLTHEEKEITKEVIKHEKEAQEIRKKIISNNEKIIKHEQEAQEIRKKIISNNEKIIAFKPLLEAGLAQLKAEQAERGRSISEFEAVKSIANNAYVTANKVTEAIKQVDTISKQQELKTQQVNFIEQKGILQEADLALDLGDYRGALSHYNKILVGRENNPLESNYKPTSEKLRQASKLYMELETLIEKLNINKALKMKLYCTGISAHTFGSFSLSKAEVLDMIKNQFYYGLKN